MSDDLHAVCARIFSRRFDSDWSYNKIAAELAASGYSISGEAVRQIVGGNLHRGVTAGLRARYADRMVVERREPLTADQLESVFVDYHEKQRSLSTIASGLGDGYDYTRIRRILQGEGEYEEPTADLRVRFPAYKQRTGRSARRPRSKALIASAFRIYFEEQASLNDVRARTGIPKGQFKALVRGVETPELTAGLRARYGSELRPGGVVAGPRWHQARDESYIARRVEATG